MEVTFTELKKKEVVNILDGKKLGKPIDFVFNSETGKLLSIIVPGEGGLSLFKSDTVTVPIRNIEQIGNDVILIKLYPISSASPEKCCEKPKDGGCAED